MWDNSFMKPLKLEEITPEKLIEIDRELEDIKIGDLTLASLKDLARSREEAINHLNSIENNCKFRAMKATQLGFTKIELSKIFNVTPNTIKKWIG